jgi:hypothetical protein
MIFSFALVESRPRFAFKTLAMNLWSKRSRLCDGKIHYRGSEFINRLTSFLLHPRRFFLKKKWKNFAAKGPSLPGARHTTMGVGGKEIVSLAKNFSSKGGLMPY